MISIKPAYAITALPLMLLGLMSLFRIPLLNLSLPLVNSIHPSWSGVVGYWVGRLALLGIFGFLSFRFVPLENVGNAENIVALRGLKHDPDPLLIVRSIAFGLVFLGHWVDVVFRSPALEGCVRDVPVCWILTSSPWAGLWMFFTLSGYLMAKVFVTKSYTTDRKGILRFYRNRIVRIVPLYMTAILVVGILRQPEMFKPVTPFSLHRLLETVLFDDAVIPIGALWSICTEMQFYLLVPFLFVLLSGLNASVRRLIAAIVGIVVLFFVLKYPALRFGSMDAWHPYIYDAMISNLDVFLIGFLTSFIVEKFKNERQGINHGLGIGLLIAAGIYLVNAYYGAHTMISINGHMRGFYLTLGPSLTAVGTAAMITCFELKRPLLEARTELSRLMWRIPTFIGLQSYALYVWHEPVLYIIRGMLPIDISVQQTFQYLPLGLFAVVVASYLSYRLIEQPFDRLRHRGRTPTVAEAYPPS